MELATFFEKYNTDLRNPLMSSFINNVYYKDFGKIGLDKIKPEVELNRNDGSGRKYKIDFVVTTAFRKYAIELHGYNFHSPDRVGKEKFDELNKKNNFIRENFDSYIELTREQVMVNPYEAICQLRRFFKADKELFSIYLNRSNKKISPSEPQQDALKAIENARNKGYSSGIIAMATGLGKTFLSGFDIQRFKPKRVLFVAHVLEILNKTKTDFEDLMKNQFADFGVFNGSYTDKPILFATIQSIHKDKNLKKFHPSHFDYIVIDEAHHAAAATYKKVLDYFKPKFLLGLTATPFRNDDKEILPLFSKNIIYEMSQEKAIKEGWLANILYEGFYDDIDYSNIRWNGNKYDIDDLNKLLMIQKRDEAIIKKFNENSVLSKTIGFCVSIDHAEYMSEKFNEAGFKAVAIHSKNESSKSNISVKERNSLLDDFRENKYQIAFTVNMFNEGVDFPDVETVLMLRPTDSLTIFIQQIGRGLRISHKKDHLRVLDFIGNYRTNNIVLDALNLSTERLEFVEKKQLYKYDNNGYEVTFEKEVVEVFRSISAKYNKEVQIDKISNYWQDYGNFINSSTKTDQDRKNSVNHYWIVDKKKRDLDQHIWAIKFMQENKNKYKSSKITNQNLIKASDELGQKSFEGIRSLFFSKLLGLYQNWDGEYTEVFLYLLNNQNLKYEIINNQMEKLYFWNDIYSRLNRHANESLVSKEEIFNIYTVLFIYQIFYRFINLKIDLFLSKFECLYFVFFARSHDEIDFITERIIEYRSYNERYELEKFLKSKVKNDKQRNQFQIFDTRYYEIFKYLKYFKFSKERIILKPEFSDHLIDKVENFQDLLKSKKIIFKTDYSLYKSMLFSKENIFQFFSLKNFQN